MPEFSTHPSRIKRAASRASESIGPKQNPWHCGRGATDQRELGMNDYPVVEPSAPSPRNKMLRNMAMVFGCNFQNF